MERQTGDQPKQADRQSSLAPKRRATISGESESIDVRDGVHKGFFLRPRDRWPWEVIDKKPASYSHMLAVPAMQATGKTGRYATVAWPG